MASLTIPNPYTNPKPYDTLEFKGAEQAFIWPPETNDDTERYGIVEWSSFKSKAKIDKKAKSGASKPKVSQTGGEGIDFSFTLVVVQSDEALDSVAPIIDALRLGSTWVLKRQPDAALVGISDFIVESIEAFPPSGGVKRYTYSCTQVDADAQAGKGGNATSTPSEQSAEQRAIDEWTARRDAAINYDKAEQARRILAEQAEAQRVFDKTGVRTAKKLSSVLAGDGEIDVNSAQPTEPSPTNVATGSVNG
jgi:hypothetical protein